MRLASAFGLFAVFAFVLYGWGRAARRLLHAESRSWPATAASGMAALVFLGGLLNLTRLAYPWALACVVVAGAVFGVLALKSAATKRGGSRAPSNIWLLAAVVLCFVVLTQTPPKAY